MNVLHKCVSVGGGQPFRNCYERVRILPLGNFVRVDCTMSSRTEQVLEIVMVKLAIK